MQVTEKTKMVDMAAFADYFGEQAVADLKKAADGRFGSPWGLTIGQMFDCMDGDFTHIGVDLSRPADLTVLQYYWMESFKDMTEALKGTMERLSVPPTPDAAKASKACLKMTARESILVFCRSYFGLRSFREVEQLTIDDLLLARKDAYNNAIFEKGMAELQKAKHK